MVTNSIETMEVSVRLAQAMADSRQEIVWLVVDNHTGEYQAIPHSNFIGIASHRDETIMKLVKPR